MTIFAHDYYILSIPELKFSSYDNINTLYDFLSYKNLKDIKGREIKEAPVIRLYGANTFGQKCCIHVHGVLFNFIT